RRVAKYRFFSCQPPVRTAISLPFQPIGGSLWLRHLECCLVSSFWRSASSGSCPELRPPVRMGCRCCLASSWSIPRTALCTLLRAQSSSLLQCQEQEPPVCGSNYSESSMRSSPSSDSCSRRDCCSERLQTIPRRLPPMPAP